MKTKIHDLYRRLTESTYYPLFILSARILLAYVFIKYGTGKLRGTQFGITEAELETPIKDLSLFRVGWYLFDQQPFRYIVGVSQIIGGILLLINRTVLLGVLMFIPIAASILIIDLTIMPSHMAFAFFFRLSWYIVLALLIFFYHSKSADAVVTGFFNPDTVSYSYKWWIYLTIPFLLVVLELSSAIFSIPFGLVLKYLVN